MDSEATSNSVESINPRLIKRHAQESWVYPIVSCLIGLFGFPMAFLQAVSIPLGIYCLARTYMNIKSGNGKGIFGHVIAGTILNLLIVSANAFAIYMFIERG